MRDPGWVAHFFGGKHPLSTNPRNRHVVLVIPIRMD